MHHLPMAQILDINNSDLRQTEVTVTGGEVDQSILTLRGIIITLHRGGGCSEQGLGTEIMGEHDGCTPRMITGCRVLLLITRFMLLIDNHQS